LPAAIIAIIALQSRLFVYIFAAFEIRHSLFATQPVAIGSALDGLGYYSITDEITAKIISDAARRALLDKFGERITEAVISKLCKMNNQTEQQLFCRCDLVEKSIGAMFGQVAIFVMDIIKDELSPYSTSKNPHPSLQEIGHMIKENEVMSFVRNMAGHEHAAFLYSKKTIKDNVLSQFFSQSAVPDNNNNSSSSRKALVSLDNDDTGPKRFSDVQKIYYDDFLKIEEKSEVMDRMFDWIGEIHKLNQSGRETRIAGEDASWFLRNGFEQEFIDAERKIGRQVQDKIAILCSYDVDGIALENQLKSVIEAHKYIITDQPLAVYVAPE
jgi:hypothetical protein